ncbi:hypothetical protein L3Q82_009570 [Scortum barcoo]|uniref:Uncharacterized protein n=1 Tax=Scortum barcoo TaxID=214431 RepID=A0ACB8WGV3_9TELE|nr:hypothetical protein L3Q82_009570 [Scortum barcoo]
MPLLCLVLFLITSQHRQQSWSHFTEACKFAAASDNRWQLLCLLLPPSPCTPCNPGDFVVVKDFRRKHWQAKRWHGPFQILLTTHTAVKVAERATWIHASHCKRVPAPAESPSTDHDTHTHH